MKIIKRGTISNLLLVLFTCLSILSLAFSGFTAGSLPSGQVAQATGDTPAPAGPEATPAPSETPALESPLEKSPPADELPPLVEPLTAEYKSDELIVKFAASASQAEVDDCLGRANASFDHGIARLNAWLLKIPANRVVESIYDLQSCPGILYAEPNYIAWAVDVIPNDTYWSYQYGPVAIRAPQGWQITTGSTEVTIAVVDTGVDLDHPDLITKIVAGYDFFYNDSTPQDDEGHGTHVAGIAAAVTNNSLGVAGVSWGARIMPVKVLGPTGSGSTYDIAQGIIWAADNGAQVINLSLGLMSDSSTMEDAVNYAFDHGVVVVAAAGNNGAGYVLYPAAYPNVIAVAATDASNNRANYSNYGAAIDVAAPGSDIYSTIIGGYDYSSGTSMATPFVAGLAGILKGIPGNESPALVKSRIESSALDLGDPGRDNYYGYGLIQVDAAIQVSLPSLAVVLSGFSASWAGDRVNVGWSTTTEINNAAFKVTRSTGGAYTEIATVASTRPCGSYAGTPPVVYGYTDMNVTPGTTYTYRLVFSGIACGFDETTSTQTAQAQAAATPWLTWYLAEGFTGAGFGTYILIQNPGDLTADITVTYMLQGGGTLTRSASVAPNSRYTIAAQDAGQVGPDQAFSTRLVSSQPIIVERAMYWPNLAGSGGHVTTGITTPTSIWYLAEGFTGAGFGTYILIQNPNSSAANIQLTYMLQTGGTLARSLSVAPNSRYTVLAQDSGQVGLDQAFSTRLVSDQPIIVERAMYFNDEGHVAGGVTSPLNTWYLAEGFTGAGFGTYILIQNPNDLAANIDLTYMLQGGGTLTRSVSVAPNSRYTVVAQDAGQVGLDQAFSTRLVSDKPIIVERAMYWPNGASSAGGHDSAGVTAAALTWYLAEGFTGAGFGTYILIQNPNDLAAEITITYMLQGGGTLTRSVTVEPNARYTVVAQDAGQVGLDQAFSTRLVSDRPIIVERAMYFTGGGHATTGVSQ